MPKAVRFSAKLSLQLKKRFTLAYLSYFFRNFES